MGCGSVCAGLGVRIRDASLKDKNADASASENQGVEAVSILSSRVPAVLCRALGTTPGGNRGRAGGLRASHAYPSPCVRILDSARCCAE